MVKPLALFKQSLVTAAAIPARVLNLPGEKTRRFFRRQWFVAPAVAAAALIAVSMLGGPAPLAGEKGIKVQTEVAARPAPPAGVLAPDLAGAATSLEAPATAMSSTPDFGRAVRPADGEIVAAFGYNFSDTFGDYRFHPGVDIAAPVGTPVRAYLDGRVKAVNSDPAWGTTVTIDLGDGWQSTYANLEKVTVKPGQAITAGEAIGRVAPAGGVEKGRGPALHWEIMADQERIDPQTASMP